MDRRESSEATTGPDIWALYARMLESRRLEEAIAELWNEGLISGEMHLGTGEEAIVAGVVAQLRDGDALALDHRGTAALRMRGVSAQAIVNELLGLPSGLCGGRGGHMHLFSRDHLAASSGIVGASGPTGAGFALAAQQAGRGGVAVAFFGEGALDQGMLMESIHLAAAWSLPAVFVCKDDGWAITTRTEAPAGGDPAARARALGVPAVEVEGRDVAEVWRAARKAVATARGSGGPSFLHARCVHLEGHFLGFQLLKMVRRPVQEMSGMALPLARSFLRSGGAGWSERASGVKEVLAAVRATAGDPRRDDENDPVLRARALLVVDPERLRQLEGRIEREVGEVVATARAELAS